MAWLTATDPFVETALWVGAAVSVMLILCCIAILTLRFGYLIRRHHLHQLLPEWRAALSGAIVGEFPSIQVAPFDCWHFIKLWCQTYDSVRGEAREAMRKLARMLGMPRWGLYLAKSPRLRNRLLGIGTLGRIGVFADTDIERLMVPLLRDPDAVLSLTTAQAFARLAPASALSPILQAASMRADWPTARLVDILREAGTAAATAPLLEAIAATSSSAKTRLVPLLTCLESQDAASTIVALLQNSEDPECLASALTVARGPGKLPFVREAAKHSAWFVRVQVCRTLGRLGTREDLALLTNLLGDRVWWVRYRAAEALLKLPSVTRIELRELASSHPDAYARDMLNMWLDESEATS